MVISGKELSARLKAEMAEQVSTFPARYGRVPHLAVVLVGSKLSVMAAGITPCGGQWKGE